MVSDLKTHVAELNQGPEYVWNYRFYQDGSCELEILLTGIIQVYAHKDGDASPYGTVVAPGVVGHYHQHNFCLRIDSMIGSLNNCEPFFLR
jgi:primary-amine oxidase